MIEFIIQHTDQMLSYVDIGFFFAFLFCLGFGKQGFVVGSICYITTGAVFFIGNENQIYDNAIFASVLCYSAAYFKQIDIRLRKLLFIAGIIQLASMLSNAYFDHLESYISSTIGQFSITNQVLYNLSYLIYLLYTPAVYAVNILIISTIMRLKDDGRYKNIDSDILGYTDSNKLLFQAESKDKRF